MEFTFNEQQLELQRSARRFLDTTCTPERVLETMATESGLDAEAWSRITEELGWTALTIPEEHGGLGMGYLDLYPLMEAMGRVLLCTPFFSTVCLGANALLFGGDESQKARWLPSIAEGSKTATVAHSERNGRHDASGIETTYVATDDGYVLSGEKYYVVDGHTADLVVVAARAPGSTGRQGVSLFLVEGDAPGLHKRRLPTVDQTRRQAELVFGDVHVGRDAILGDEGAGFPVLEKTLDLAACALAAEQVGAAERCLEMSVEYAKVRKQFDRPIGSFQAIKHKCADMLAWVESARSAAFYASAVADDSAQGLAEAASSAKVFCSNAFFECASENIQIHGGIGFTWEHPAHLYFKRARSSEVLLGDPKFHRERVAQEMGL